MRRDYDIKNETFFILLKEFINKNGYTPSIREMCNYVGLSSPATVYYHLGKLEAKGKIKRINNRKIIILEDKND